MEKWTLEQLQSRCTYWQERLNLREWTITLKWGAKGKQGFTTWSTEEMTATVELNKRCKLKEETLIHELLHLVMEGYGEKPVTYDVHLERGLNKVAAAFLHTPKEEATL